VKGKDVKYLALQHGILLTENKAVIKEGWEGKAKGILQILRECGLIDESNYKTMTLNGTKDPETGKFSWVLHCMVCWRSALILEMN